MNRLSCEGELNKCLPKGWRGTILVEEGLGCDYAIEVLENAVVVRASRVRNAWCAIGVLESAAWQGRLPTGCRVRSPLPIRMVEAWAPMHDHLFLPRPEYHEHSWHMRLRRDDTGEMDEQAIDMALVRFDKYAKLVAKQGFTHVVLDDPDYLPLFPGHPEIYPPDSGFHRRHSIYRRLFYELIRLTRSYDLEFVLFCMEVGFTPPTLAFFGDICPANETMWDLAEEKYDEIVCVFPEIEGFMFKMSDAFLSPDNLYLHRDLFHHECPGCAGMTPIGRTKIFLDRIYQCIVQRHGKKLYYRTWDVNDGIHVDINRHRELFAGLDDPRVHPLLKYTKGDFQLSNPFHPGIGGMKGQIIEYQFKLEHDGHSVLPLYIGGVHQQSLQENIAKGISGIWAWPSGGGRSSINNITHFKGFTRFAEMNQFVFSRVMMEPERPHREFLILWGDGELGRPNGVALADILTDLMEAFRLMCNFGDLWTGEREYAKTSFNHGWFFDWHAFRHGNSRIEAGEVVIRTRVLPNISDLEAAIARLHESSARFAEARKDFEKNIVEVVGFEQARHAFLSQFLAAEAFASLCALWVEALLRHYGGSAGDPRMADLLDRLEAAKTLYDRNHGVFVTQCMDYFISRARETIVEELPTRESKITEL